MFEYGTQFIIEYKTETQKWEWKVDLGLNSSTYLLHPSIDVLRKRAEFLAAEYSTPKQAHSMDLPNLF